MARDNKRQPDRNASSGRPYGRGAVPSSGIGRPSGNYSSYGMGNYGGYGGVGNSPYGNGGAYGGVNNGAPNGVAQQTANANGANQQAEVKGRGKHTNVEKVNLPEKGHRSRKEKKLAKKSEKFDETDLRNYPMTVGSWIGTFILLAIPLIGGICAICWFFGVGNRSRTAWVRSYVVIMLLVVLLLGIGLGVGYGLLSKAAKEEAGASSFKEVVYFGADKVIGLLEGTIGEDVADGVRQYLAEMLGISNGETNNDEEGGDQTNNGGQLEEGGETGGLEEAVA
ncbi:MAG: hypothetical protein OSJ74_09115 [Clostridia bacterium]|nr:hypothetical protein [Clostridia bacterium]